ncbi:MAG: hypothetical protein OXR73_11090, partial [Myxococcales bacterium]|nr:hypothetical protein [Myxococcales bacterium]
HERFPTALRIAFAPRNPAELVVSTTFGLLHSRDGGRSFRYVCAAGLGAGPRDAPAVTLGPEGRWTVGLISGLVHSKDAGCTMTADPTLGATFVSDVRAVNESDTVLLVTASSQSDNQLYVSIDGGATFQARGTSLGDQLLRNVHSAPSDPDVLYVSAARPAQEVGETRTSTLLRSDDGGEHFEALPVPFSEDSFELLVMAVDPENPKRVYAVRRRADSEPLLRSDDGGEHFEEIFSAPGPLLGVAIGRDGSLYVGGEQAGLWRSDGRGGTFEQLHDDLQVTCLSYEDDALFVCDRGLTSGFQVGRSEDRGETFAPVLRFADLDGVDICRRDTKTGAICAEELADVHDELAIFREVAQSTTAPDPSGTVDAGAAGSELRRPNVTGRCSIASSDPSASRTSPLTHAIAFGLYLLARLRRRRRW